MKSKRLAALATWAESVVTTKSLAPRRVLSDFFDGDVLRTVTSAPSDAANLTPMCPSPPSPTIATFCPFPTFQCRNGE